MDDRALDTIPLSVAPCPEGAAGLPGDGRGRRRNSQAPRLECLNHDTVRAANLGRHCLAGIAGISDRADRSLSMAAVPLMRFDNRAIPNHSSAIDYKHDEKTPEWGTLTAPPTATYYIHGGISYAAMDA